MVTISFPDSEGGSALARWMMNYFLAVGIRRASYLATLVSYS